MYIQLTTDYLRLAIAFPVSRDTIGKSTGTNERDTQCNM